MNRSFAEIAQEAMTLPQNEQLRLARTLLEQAEASGDLRAEAAWEEEIERRIQKIDAGLAEGRPFGDVLREIDLRLGRGRGSHLMTRSGSSLNRWPTRKTMGPHLKRGQTSYFVEPAKSRTTSANVGLNVNSVDRTLRSYFPVRPATPRSGPDSAGRSSRGNPARPNARSGAWSERRGHASRHRSSGSLA